MPFSPQPGHYYRMPIFFGPKSGPREWPADRAFDFTKTPRKRVAGVRFLGNADQLNAFLPAGLSVWGEPIVTVEITYMTEIGWLAGRGYNMCDVRFDACFQGKGEPVHGTLVLVRWENLADPILSGREELGHNKLYCEIPELRVLDGTCSATLSWLSTPFLDLSVSDLSDADAPVRDPRHQGMLSYKYIPKTGEWGVAEVEYATLSPNATVRMETSMRKAGQGTVAFRRSAWEDLPTLYRIVNAFADLENHGSRGGYLFDQTGGASQSETRRLY